MDHAAELRPAPSLSIRPIAVSTAAVAGFIAFWWLASLTGVVARQFLPTPLTVCDTFVNLLRTPYAGSTLENHLLFSLGRFAGGFLLAVLIGVPLGLSMGLFRWLDQAVSPLFNAARFVSPIAWVAFAALWFGTGPGGPMLVIFVGAFPSCVINAYRGAKFADVRLLEAARTLGASPLRIVCQVLLPAALPSIVAGLRVAAGMGWQSLIGAELIVATAGIGYMMVAAQTDVRTPVVMCGMIAIGIVGLIIDVLLQGLGRYVSGRAGIPKA